MIRPDGSVRWVGGEGYPVGNERGEVHAIAAIWRDITERKRTEAALQESEGRFRQLSEAAFEGIAISEKGKFLDVNATFARMFGYELSELIGMDVLELVAPESRELASRHHLSDYEKLYECQCLRKDGSVFPVEIQSKSVRYEGQTVSAKDLRKEIQKTDTELLTGKNASYNLSSGNDPCSTIAGLIAASLGYENIYKLTDEEKQKIKCSHLLLAFFNCMQPGVFAVSGWDLVGALPVPKEWVSEQMFDGDSRWINRGGIRSSLPREKSRTHGDGTAEGAFSLWTTKRTDQGQVFIPLPAPADDPDPEDVQHRYRPAPLRS